MKRLLIGANIILVLICMYASYWPLTASFSHLTDYPPFYDYKIFYACAHLLRQGGNPYDANQMVGQYTSLFHYPKWLDYNVAQGTPCLQSPLTFAAISPFLLVSLPVSYALWLLLLAGCLIVSVRLLQRLWPIKNALHRSLIFLVSPIVVWGMYEGQMDDILLLLWVAALWWTCRRKYGLAAFVLMLGLMKPQMIVGPVLLLGVIAWRHKQIRSYGWGALTGTSIALALMLAVGGLVSIEAWFHGMLSFSSTYILTVGDLSSVTGYYIGWMPQATRFLTPICFLIWAACSWFLLRKVNGEEGERWWLMMCMSTWLLTTPYAHSHDAVILLPALWLLWSRPFANRGAKLAECFLWVIWWFFPIITFLPLQPLFPAIRGFGSIPVIAIALALWQYRPNADAALPVNQPVALQRSYSSADLS